MPIAEGQAAMSAGIAAVAVAFSAVVAGVSGDPDPFVNVSMS
jgi:hypothetical protein